MFLCADVVFEFRSPAIAISFLEGFPPRFAMMEDAMSPDEAAMWSKPFVYRTHARGAPSPDALLLEWVAPRPRAGRHGITGTARLLQAEPAGSRDGDVGKTFRIHVCRACPCVTESWHPSKYGSCPPPQAHGSVVALVEEVGAANLASYLHVPQDGFGDAIASATADTLPCAHLAPESISCDALPEAPATTTTDPAHAPLLDGCSVASTAVEEDIRRRGDTVRKCGAYIGLFELLVFCSLRRRRVFLCLSEGWVDVTTAHAPFLHDGAWTPTPYPVTIIACTRSPESNAWVPGTFYNTGHYVCGQPIPKAYDPGGSSLAAWCARNALVPVMTCANGDCGIDALLVLEGSPRGAERRQALRLEICAHMVHISIDARWQDVFRNLEVWPEAALTPPPPPPPPGPPPPPLPPPPAPTPGPAPPTGGGGGLRRRSGAAHGHGRAAGARCLLRLHSLVDRSERPGCRPRAASPRHSHAEST